MDMDKSGCNDLVSISPCCDAQATAPRPKRVAVMQPYFFPYAGYFRLLHAVDDFVIFDCVQFPRRGRVHRTQVPGPTGQVEWLTLPLARHSRDTLIRDLAFAPDARRPGSLRTGHQEMRHGTLTKLSNRWRRLAKAIVPTTRGRDRERSSPHFGQQACVERET